MDQVMECCRLQHLIRKHNVMQPIQNISIPEACHQQWQQMTPIDNGRHCQQCCKTVTDFTVMTNSEILNYLSAHKDVCGRFDKERLDALNVELIHQGKIRFGWKQLALGAALASLFTTIKAEAKTIYRTEQMPVINKKPPVTDTPFRIINGKVIAFEDGLPLPGATVKALKSEAITTTNINGEYKLEVFNSVDTLVVSYIGFKTQKVRLDSGLLAHNVTMMVDSVRVLYSVVGGISVGRRIPFYEAWWHKIKRIF